jgi:uncharacterized protein YndB with AHSA1/START domain
VRIFSATRDIAASPARVWAVLVDVERWPEWTASMTRIERLDGGPLGRGSHVRVQQPKLAPARFEITSWVPERAFDWITKSPGITAIARHAIEPTSGGTRVTLSVEFSGWLAGLVVWWFGELTSRYVAMEADGLKRRSEDLASG